MNESVKLYLDEDVPVVIAEILRSAGFDVLTTEEACRRRAEDADQLAFAAKERRAMLTHNVKHFVRLHTLYLEQRLEHAGVIAAVRRRVVYDVARRVLALLKTVTADDMRNDVRYV